MRGISCIGALIPKLFVTWDFGLWPDVICFLGIQFCISLKVFGSLSYTITEKLRSSFVSQYRSL